MSELQEIHLEHTIASMKNAVIKESEFKKLEKEGKLLPEPLLTENDQRFVLFPIKHQQVNSPVSSSILYATHFLQGGYIYRCGTCTRRLRRPSGRRRSWILPMTTKTGRGSPRERS